MVINRIAELDPVLDTNERGALYLRDMANTSTTTSRPRKTIDEKIELEQARIQNLAAKIEKLGAPITEVKRAELALAIARQDEAHDRINALVASKTQPEIPAELKSDINSIKKAIKVATKYEQPEYVTLFVKFLKGLEGMAAPQEQAAE